MANRYTDTDKWDDDWFLNLSPKLKCVWGYLCDNVKGCGELKISFKKLSDCIGESVTRDEFDSTFSERIVWIGDDLVWIPGTLARMYRNFSPKIKAEVNVARKVVRITQGFVLSLRAQRERDRCLTFLSSLSPISSEPISEFFESAPDNAPPVPDQGLARLEPGPECKEEGGRRKEKDLGKGGSGENQSLVPDAPPDPETAGAFGPRELAAAWNERMASVRTVRGTPMPLVEKLDSKQERWIMARARLAEEPRREVWLDVIDRIARSEFCRGKGSKSDWVANFIFLVRPKTLIGVLEGEYGCSPRAQARAQPPPPAGPNIDAIPDDPEERRRILDRVRSAMAEKGNLGQHSEGA